jgi:hypothetical protein
MRDGTGSILNRANRFSGALKSNKKAAEVPSIFDLSAENAKKSWTAWQRETDSNSRDPLAFDGRNSPEFGALCGFQKSSRAEENLSTWIRLSFAISVVSLVRYARARSWVMSNVRRTFRVRIPTSRDGQAGFYSASSIVRTDSSFCGLARRYQHPPAVLHVIDPVEQSQPGPGFT